MFKKCFSPITHSFFHRKVKPSKDSKAGMNILYNIEKFAATKNVYLTQLYFQFYIGTWYYALKI